MTLQVEYEPIKEKTNVMHYYHTAGIIPVVNSGMAQDLTKFYTENEKKERNVKSSIFGFKWPDYMMPIAQNYTLVENAVHTAAWAGCKTIWIAAEPKDIVLLKSILGSWVVDPISIKYDFNFKDSIKYYRRIPIIYTPFHPSKAYRRENLAWNILWPAYVATHVLEKVSKWAIPRSFFVCFPMGLASKKSVREGRKTSMSGRSRVLYTFEGKSIKDGLFMPFSFLQRDIEGLIEKFVDLENKLFIEIMQENQKARDELEKQIEGKHHNMKRKIRDKYVRENDFLTLEDVMNKINLKDIFGELPSEVFRGQEDRIIELKWFYNLDSWQSFKEAIRGPAGYIRRPSKRYLPPVFKRQRQVIEEIDEIGEQEV